MSADVLMPGETQRYEAVLRISEALFACRQLEDLARILADQLGEVLSFDHLDVVVLKENPEEIEWHAWGKGPVRLLEPPIEEMRTWHLYDTQETLLISDWNMDERFPHLKELVAKTGVEIGSVIRVPLATGRPEAGRNKM